MSEQDLRDPDGLRRDGTLISEETWNTSYKGETRIVRVGTKPKPKPEPPPKKPPRTASRGRAYAAGDAAVDRLGEPAGTRVGRSSRGRPSHARVASATSSPSAHDAVLVAEARPADVPQRTQTVSRSSKYAARW